MTAATLMTFVSKDKIHGKRAVMRSAAANRRGRITTAVARNAAGVTERTAQRYIVELANEGLLERVSFGLYAITQKGRDSL